MREFAWVYRSMGTQGWAPSDVDRMECWQVADFLGSHGDRGIIRGASWVQWPDDHGAPSIVDDAPDFHYRPDGDPLTDTTWGMDARSIRDADRIPDRSRSR